MNQVKEFHLYPIFHPTNALSYKLIDVCITAINALVVYLNITPDSGDYLLVMSDYREELAKKYLIEPKASLLTYIDSTICYSFHA